ncbi:unnamed protein product [Closterium sp. NIES-64]|nr:unnamed protein product [Closterium sp. NIES-64]
MGAGEGGKISDSLGVRPHLTRALAGSGLYMRRDTVPLVMELAGIGNGGRTCRREREGEGRWRGAIDLRVRGRPAQGAHGASIQDGAMKAGGGAGDARGRRRGMMARSGDAGVVGRVAVMGVVAVMAMVGSDEGLTKGGWAQRCFWRSSGCSCGFLPIMMAHAAPLNPSQWPALRDMKAQWSSVAPQYTDTWKEGANCGRTTFGVLCDADGYVTKLVLMSRHHPSHLFHSSESTPPIPLALSHLALLILHSHPRPPHPCLPSLTTPPSSTHAVI